MAAVEADAGVPLSQFQRERMIACVLSVTHGLQSESDSLLDIRL